MKESKENHTQKLSHCFNFLFRIDLLFKLRNREYWLVSPLIILKSTGTDRKSVHQANKWNTHDTYSYIFTCITFLMTKGCHNVNVNCRNVLLVFISNFFFRFWKTDFIFCLLSIWVRKKNVWANKWCFVPAKYSIINSWNDNYSNFFVVCKVFSTITKENKTISFDFEQKKEEKMKKKLLQHWVNRKATHWKF